MTVFFKWSVEQDAEFRGAYEIQTGEGIQAPAQLCIGGTEYTAASSRATQTDLEIVKGLGIKMEWRETPYETE